MDTHGFAHGLRHQTQCPQALASVQQPPILLRCIACNTFSKSLVQSCPFHHPHEVYSRQQVPQECCCPCFHCHFSQTQFSSTTLSSLGTKVISIPSFVQAGKKAYCGSPCIMQQTCTWTTRNFNSHDTLDKISYMPPHLLCHVQVLRQWWRCARDHTCQDHVFPLCWRVGRIFDLIMPAASSLLINIRVGGVAFHATEPDDAASHTPAACVTNGGCFLRGGTSDCTDISPILIVGWKSVGGAFRIP